MMHSTFYKTQVLSIWTRRQYGFLTTNVMLTYAVDVCGLLVLREELYKDLFTKKKYLNEKKKLLATKEKELSVLNKIVSLRKKNRLFPKVKDHGLNVKLEASLIQNSSEPFIKVEESAVMLQPESVSAFKLPVYLLKKQDGQKVSLSNRVHLQAQISRK